MDSVPNRGEGNPLDQLKLENQLCFPLYTAARQVVCAYTPLLKPLGLTYTQYIVCLSLWETGTSTVGTLGRRLRLDCGTLTPLLKKLEEAGYVTRTRSREDERVVTLTVTEKGWQLREQAQDIPRRMACRQLLSAEDALTLYTLLYRLMDRLEEKADGDL